MPDTPEQPAPICANEQTTMVKQPDGGWKCPTCGFRIPPGETEIYMRCVSGRQAKFGDNPVDPCSDLRATSDAASDGYYAALLSWAAAANTADSLYAAKEAALAAYESAYHDWYVCANPGGP